MVNLLLILSVFIFFTAVFYVGNTLVIRLFPKLENLVETYAWSFAVGIVFYSLFFQFLGILHLIYPWILVSSVLIPFFTCLFQLIRKYQSSLKIFSFKIDFKKHIYNKANLLFLLLLFILGPLIPHLFKAPISWDGTAYHLLLSKVFIKDHFLSFYQHFPQTTYPIGILALYGYAESILINRLSNFIAFSFILSSSIYLLFGLDWLADKKVLYFAAFLAMFRPFLYSESSVTTFIDFGFGFFGLLTGIALLKFLKTKSANWLVILISLNAFMTLIKYTGLFFPIATVCVLFIEYLYNKKLFKSIKMNSFYNFKNLIILMSTSLVSAFWYLRNYFYTSNPIHPYFNDFFKGFDYEYSSHRNLLKEVNFENQFMVNTIKNFWRGNDLAIDYVNLSDIILFLLSILFLILGLFWFKKREFRLLSLFTLLIFVPIIIIIGPVYRYYLPVVFLISIIISQLTSQFIKKPTIFSNIIVLIIIGSSIIQLDAVWNQRLTMLNGTPKKRQLQLIVNSEFGNSFIGLQDNFRTIEFANNNLNQETDKILSIFDNRLYYFDIPSEFMHPSRFGYFTNTQLDTADKIYTKLIEDDFTHIMVSGNWGRHPNLQTAAFNDFINEYVEVVYYANKVNLYKLK